MFSNGGQGLSIQKHSTCICLMPTMCTVVLEPCHSRGTVSSEETIAYTHEQVLNSYDLKGWKCGFTLKFSSWN